MLMVPSLCTSNLEDVAEVIPKITHSDFDSTEVSINHVLVKEINTTVYHLFFSLTH